MTLLLLFFSIVNTCFLSQSPFTHFMSALHERSRQCIERNESITMRHYHHPISCATVLISDDNFIISAYDLISIKDCTNARFIDIACVSSVDIHIH
jgi:hypothetical protein